MKKFFPLLLLVLASIYTNAQTVTSTQTTLISKRTADWCPFCGSYGWSFMNKLIEKEKGKDAVIWGIHYSGGLATPTTQALAANLGGVGQPLFFLNTDDDDLGVTSQNVDAMVEETSSLIDVLSLFQAAVNMGTEAKLKGKALTVNTKVKFPEDVESGEYYVATYLVKNNLVWTQASVGPNAVHKNVLDKSLNAEHFGVKVAKAPVAKDTEYDVTVKLDELVLHNGKLEDTKIVTVVWNKIAGGKYVFINARETAIVLDNTSASKDIDNKTLDFDVAVTPQSINIKINGDVSNPVISMYDINGKEVIFNIGKNGDNDYQLEYIQAATGNYFIQVSDGKKSRTKQVYFQN